MSSIATLRWASAIGTLLLAVLSSVVVATAPKPAGAPLRPAIKPLAADASIQTRSYVS